MIPKAAAANASRWADLRPGEKPMTTIDEYAEIAKIATEKIADEFAEVRFSNPPIITAGMVRVVMEAAQQQIVADGRESAGESGSSKPAARS
jgi:hypothetical protein